MEFKKRVQEHPIWIVGGFMVLAVIATWHVLNITLIQPRDKEIESLRSQAKEQKANVEPDKKLIAQLQEDKLSRERDLKNTQNQLQQWQEALEKWRLENKRLNHILLAAYDNIDTYRKIEILESQKSNIFKQINELLTLGLNENPAGEIAKSSILKIAEHKKHVAQLQEQILDLQRKIRCQP
ncbi:MAG: hypothetical protein C4550_02695 [Nitrospiraceae bacterium]|nr:MAG: hypothetical protein C4550_02695 [Nitrospiraceae bacterium]